MEEPKKAKRRRPLIGLAIVIAVIATSTFVINSFRAADRGVPDNDQVDSIYVSKQKILEYNEAVKHYNIVADKYTKISGIASLKNMGILPDIGKTKLYLGESIRNSVSEDITVQDVLQIQKETKKLKDALIRACSAFNQKIAEYNEAVKNYNAVVGEYKKIREITSLENIDSLPKVKELKVYLKENVKVSDFIQNGILQDDVVQGTELITQETDELLYVLILAQQITNPNEKWVIDRLKFIDDIIDMQAVTASHDPNQLLNVDGGYTSCVYFSVYGINQSSIRGTSIIDKGTDAGGAVEVYKTVTDAQNRCDYLSQFDDTLLYSGSYAILGTNVIRTSYLLTNEQQVELTDKITIAFTALK